MARFTVSLQVYRPSPLIRYPSPVVQLAKSALRYIAITKHDSDTPRIMVVPIEHGAALLFTFDSHCDGGCTGDCWFECVSDAVACVAEDYDVSPDAWFVVDDPPAYCQQDWLTPARVPGRETGDPCFGRLELFTDGKWHEIDISNAPKIEIDYDALTRLAIAPP